MLLEKLIILAEGAVIREIPFKRGVNLILDKSVSDDRTASGNSIGKTTCLRVVDFCLGSEGTDVYTDQEFKIPNDKILHYLRTKSVTAVLEVSIGERRVVLTRSFGDPAIFKIDETDYSNETDYRKAIEILFFDIKDSKPTLRQLMPKFIRKDAHEMSKSVKYLHSSTTDSDYELIYTYLFGVSDIELAKQRHGLKKEISRLQKKLLALKEGNTLPALRHAVQAIDRSIKEEEEKKKLYDIEGAYDEKLSELQDLKRGNAGFSQKIAELETEIQMHTRTLSELRTNVSNADPRAIHELYQEAQHYLKEINKDFEELLYFHNHLVENKLEFVEKNILDKTKLKETLETTLSQNLSKEKEIFRLLSGEGALDDLEVLFNKINKLYQEKGRREQLIIAIDTAAKAKKEAEDTLKEINEKYEKSLRELEASISHFNQYFQDYAKALYEEDFIFSYDDSKESLKFLINNLEGNVGSGKKKATIAAFDFSFISFFADTQRSLPRFVLHDGIEDIVDNQIKTLFEIAGALQGQYVVSLISDRLTSIGLDQKFLDDNTILWLSQEDKFFKVP